MPGEWRTRQSKQCLVREGSGVVSTREKPAVAPASSRQGEKSRQDAGATESVSIRSRGRLPHWERAEGTYFVTFRLAGTLPSQVLESWEADRRESEALAKQQGRDLNVQERRRLHDLYTERIDAYLDSGAGECWMRNPDVARIVVRSLAVLRRPAVRPSCLVGNAESCARCSHRSAGFQPAGERTKPARCRRYEGRA